MAIQPWQIFPKPFFSALYNLSYRSQVGPEFLASTAARFANPHNHVTSSDEVSWTLNANMLGGMDDRKALSLFTRGFFGGYVFGMERILLTMGAWRLLPVHFSTFPHGHAKEIWQRSEIPEDDLCSVGTEFFGAFKLLDKYLSVSTSSSYVDYGFGSNINSFAGCHRFRITRIPSTVETEEQIRISLEGFHCDPQKNKLWMPRIGLWFHTAYAKVLFANGVQSVLDGAPESPLRR